MRLLAIVGFFSVMGVTLAEDKKDTPTVTELAVKVDGFPKGKVTEPTVITSDDELKKTFPDEANQKTVKSSVDFTKQKVLFFAWSGSGQDRLSFSKEAKDKDSVVLEFTYKAGLTRDLRSHTKVFVVPKDAKFKVLTGR